MKKLLVKILIWFLILFLLTVILFSVYLISQVPLDLYFEGVQLDLDPRIANQRSSEKQLAPDFSLLDLNGQENKLSDFQGRIVILSFWTSWNNFSLDQLKVLNSYYKSGAKDVVILAINSQEDTAIVKDIRNSYADNLVVLLDTNGEVGELYGIDVLPLTVFIDKKGFQDAKTIGSISINEIKKKINLLR